VNPPGQPQLGAADLGDGRTRFRVWAPFAEGVELHIVAPDEHRVPMDKRPQGYFQTELTSIAPSSRYLYRLFHRENQPLARPDPASRYQPEGVHGPSQVVAADFPWEDAGWFGRPLSEYVIYELHVGTYTPPGTFDAVIEHLPALGELGVTAIELMPVAQFPGTRNWGYDGVYPFAVQNSYGGPAGLKRLVNACHQHGLAVVLDVVYNHLGPEGNYLRDFGPYFTDFYQTPWGEAVNFDGPHSDEVRRYFIENALQWISEFHVDALRLDAVHAILDFSARPFLEVLARAVHRRAEALNRRIHLIAESALNDTRIVRPRELGGFALDAQWNDDFHHCLHTVLTGEHSGYYKDYGGLEDLAVAWEEGFVYSGRYSAFRQRAHGNSSRNVPAGQLVVCSQNHDQVGNRIQGERLGQLVSFEKQKLAAALVLLSPFIPLIFMGEEYGETAPFLYFVSHGDPDLVQAVREGRKREFAAFEWAQEPPDPQDEQTFGRSQLNHDLRREGRHRVLYDFYRELLRLRNGLAPLANLSKKSMTVTADRLQNLLQVRRWHRDESACLIFHFHGEPSVIRILLPDGDWHRELDSGEPRWEGPGSKIPEHLHATGAVELTPAPWSVTVFRRRVPGGNPERKMISRNFP
jgi:maltooligosyltrehalose trehalohydrolase